MTTWYYRNKAEQLRRNKEDKAANPEKWKEWSRNSYHRRKADPKNIKAYLLKNAKARATQKELPFDITEEDIILPEICPVFKRPFDRNDRRTGYSLDRITPELGYVKGNIQVISQLANAMKWDSTPSERLLFAEWILSTEREVPLANS